MYLDVLKWRFSNTNTVKADYAKHDEHTVNPLISAIIIREYSDHQRPHPVKWPQIVWLLTTVQGDYQI